MTQYSFSFLTDYFHFFAADRRYDWKSQVSIKGLYAQSAAFPYVHI